MVRVILRWLMIWLICCDDGANRPHLETVGRISLMTPAPFFNVLLCALFPSRSKSNQATESSTIQLCKASTVKSIQN